MYGDLNGQLNALKIGVERLDALLDEYGADVVNESLQALRRRAATLMSDYIAEIRDGCYAATDFLDNDGIEDTALPIALDIRIDGARMTLDFSRTAACRGPVNISRSAAIASCYVALKHVFPDVPANAGVLEAIDFVIPDDSLLNATAPRPVGGYTETILRIIDLVFVALSEACPERVNGCAYGTINALSLAGFRRDGSRWVMFSFFAAATAGIRKVTA